MVNSPYMAFSPSVCHNNKENLVFHAYIQSVAVTPKEDFVIMTDKTHTRQFLIRQWADAIKDQRSSGLTVDQWCGIIPRFRETLAFQNGSLPRFPV